MTDLNEIVETLSNLSVVEVAEISKMLEEKWGVTAAVPVVAATATASEPAAAEKTSFNVVLQSVGASKINVIKALREVTGLGLVEAKALAESAPKEVKTGVNKTEAEEIKKKLEGAGATVELK